MFLIILSNANKDICSDVELTQKALEQNDLPPKYREYLKLRIEESSPVDYREITIPKPTFIAVSN